MFPFQMTQKRVEFSYEMGAVFEKMKKYGHKTDGLMFTSEEAPYTLGTCPKMYYVSLSISDLAQNRLKWKPSEENTVDFKLKKVGDGYHLLIIIQQGDYRDFGELTLDDEMAREWSRKKMDGRIVECRWDPEWPNHWRFSRYRDDKSESNHIGVYEKILESIRDNVTKEEVFLFDVTDFFPLCSYWIQFLGYMMNGRCEFQILNRAEHFSRPCCNLLFTLQHRIKMVSL